VNLKTSRFHVHDLSAWETSEANVKIQQTFQQWEEGLNEYIYLGGWFCCDKGSKDTDLSVAVTLGRLNIESFPPRNIVAINIGKEANGKLIMGCHRE